MSIDRGSGRRSGVESITTTSPLAKTGSATNPTLSVTEAGAAQAGVVSTGAQTIAGKKTFAGGVAVAEGTEALPGLAAEDDADTGIRLGSAANTIAVSTGGATRATVTDSALTTTVPVVGPSGTATAPAHSFSTETNSGLYRGSAGLLGIAVGGSTPLHISAATIVPNVPTEFPVGAVGAPSIAFNGDANTGIYRPTADELAFTTGGTQRARFKSAGHFVPGASITYDLGDVAAAWNAVHTRYVRDGNSNQRLDYATSPATGSSGYYGRAAATGQTAHFFGNGAATMTSGDIAVFSTDLTTANTKLAISAQGKITQSAGDSSGSPGDATINAPVGKSAMAAAASTVTITNSCVTANSIVMITPLDIDPLITTWKVAAAAGSFTVTSNDPADATWRFAWQVLN